VNFPALSLQQQVQGRFNFGYSYFNLRKLDEALGEFDFVKTQNSPFSPAANYYAGFIEFSKGMYDEALVDLKRSESNAAYANIVPYLIANVYYKLRKYDELIGYFAGVSKRASSISNYDEISMLVADAYYYKSDYEKAAAAYEEYLEDNTARAEGTLLFRAGFANYSLSRNDKALEYLKNSAAKQDSVSYYSSYYLGILYLKEGNKQSAANAFDYARKYGKDRRFAEESLYQLAKVTYDQGKPDLSISEFEKFLNEFPSSEHAPEVKELLAHAYVNGNNYNKAIEYIEALPQKSATTQQAYQKATYLKGAELFNKDDYQHSVEYFTKSLMYPIDPNYVALSALWCAEAYSIGRKYEEAQPMYQKVVALGSTAEKEIMARTRYGLGYAYFNLKQYDQALFNFKEYTTKYSKSGGTYTDALVRLADCYYASKSYQEAITNYNQARKLNSPDDDYIVFQIGMIQGILRNYADARSQFRILISNYPKSQYRDEAMFQAAQFEIEQVNYQVAIDVLTRLINEGKG
jgi:tetratricopeptide (TPR) repeat protein